MMLLDWTRVYQSLYDMPSSDRPDTKTIENDGKLDQWFNDFQQEVAQQTAAIKRKKKVNEKDYLHGMPT